MCRGPAHARDGQHDLRDRNRQLRRRDHADERAEADELEPVARGQAGGKGHCAHNL